MPSLISVNWLFHSFLVEVVVIVSEYFAFPRYKEENERTFRASIGVFIDLMMISFGKRLKHRHRDGTKKALLWAFYLLQNYSTQENKVFDFHRDKKAGANGFANLSKCLANYNFVRYNF